MGMTLNNPKLLTSTAWNEKYQPPTFVMSKYKYKGRYRLGLGSLFVPDTKLFQTKEMSIYPNLTKKRYE